MAELQISNLLAGVRFSHPAHWEHICIPLLRGTGHGLEALIRPLVPWVVAGLFLLFLLNYNPQAAEILLQFAVVIGLLVAVVWWFGRRRH